jgi:hypothetical protein
MGSRGGRLLRTVPVGQGDHAVAVDERTGHVSLPRTVLRTIPVGPNPLAVAVDEPLSHAFVLSGGS